jgi:uncharacterized membrane protein
MLEAATPAGKHLSGYRHKMSEANEPGAGRIARTVGRIALGAFLLMAGISHLTIARAAFQAQVPTWIPLDKDFVVIASGVVEITLGVAVIALSRYRVIVGWTIALFFLAVFPGNVSQLVTHTDSFGLNSDLTRGIRLLFQPLLVVWALWSTGAWRAWRQRRRAGAGGAA